jgi:hypothetical protein
VLQDASSKTPMIPFVERVVSCGRANVPVERRARMEQETVVGRIFPIGVCSALRDNEKKLESVGWCFVFLFGWRRPLYTRFSLESNTFKLYQLIAYMGILGYPAST